MSRMADANLRAAEAVFTFARARFGGSLKSLPQEGDWASKFKKIEQLRLNAALTLHHDAITGTSRTTVVRDYKQRLVTSSNSVKGIAAEMVELLLEAEPKKPPSAKKFKVTGTDYTLPLGKLPPVSDGSSSDAATFPVIVQNPLGWRRQDVVSVGLEANVEVCKELQVVDDMGRPVRAQVAATLNERDCHTVNPTLNMRLFIEVDVPAMGLRTYFVRRASRKDSLEKNNLAEFTQTQIVVVSRTMGHVTAGEGSRKSRSGMLRRGDNSDDKEAAFRRLSSWPTDKSFMGPGPSLNAGANSDGSKIELQTARLGVMFQKWSGNIESITNKKCCQDGKGQGAQGATRKTEQKWMRYSSTRSGAYLFRPHGPAASNPKESEIVTLAVIKGSLVQQVRYYASHVQQVTSLYNIAGPLGGVVHFHPSTTADMNTEVVLRFTTNLASAGKFYTDNGAELVEREFDSNKPIPANFYPMNSGIALREVSKQNKNPKQVMVLNEHPMACASLSHTASTSDIEMMLQRSLRSDDGRGLAQGVHDSSRGGGPMFLLLDEADKASSSYRMLSQLLHNRAQIYLAEPKPVARNEWLKEKRGFFAPLGGQLPPSLHVFTLKVKDEGKDDGQGDVVLRLQNFANEIYHIPSTAKSLASPGLFLAYTVDNVRERTLSVVDDAAKSQSKRLHYPTANRDDDDAVLGSVVDGGDGAAEGGDDGNQNTDEEGVFISAAALSKLEEDKRSADGTRRRQLLADGSASGGYVFEVPAFQLRTYLLNMHPAKTGPSATALSTPQVVKTKQVTEQKSQAAENTIEREVPNAAAAGETLPQKQSEEKVMPKTPPKLPIDPTDSKTAEDTETSHQKDHSSRGSSLPNEHIEKIDAHTQPKSSLIHKSEDIAKQTPKLQTSVSIDGSRVPTRIRDAHAWANVKHNHSLVSIELGFFGGTLFGISLVIVGILCRGHCQSKSKGRGERRIRKSGRDSGTPFRKSY